MEKISEAQLAYLHHKIVMRDKLDFEDRRVLNMIFGQALKGEPINTGKILREKNESARTDCKAR
jgi:hypothetical protein